MITATITAEDISLGRRCSSEMCPVARAATRAAGRPIRVGVFNMWVAGDVRRSARVPLHPTVAKFVDDFDGCRPVGPFSFELPDSFRKDSLEDTSDVVSAPAAESATGS